MNVLTGPNEAELGERFASLRDAYDPELRRAAARPPRASWGSGWPRASTSR